MPNGFAYLALFSWPLVALLLFRLMPPLRAMIWTILGGYLFLPVGTGINLPMLPTFDKELIPSLSAAVLVWFALRREAARERLIAAREKRRNRPAAGADAGRDEAAGGEPTEAAPAIPPQRQWNLVARLSALGVLLVLVLPFAVYLTNREPLVFETRAMPGMKPYDAFSMALGRSVMLLPFLLGWRYLRGPEAPRELLRAFVLGGLIYSLPILLEVRLSPQLNVWIYGYFPHSFIQFMRDGGYRPLVFLEHALRVGIFVAMACLAAAALVRPGPAARWIAAMLWLGLVMVLAKTLGALMILLLLLPVALFAGRRLQIHLVAALAGIVLLYPMIRGAGLVPTETALQWAAGISDARARSLGVRLRNEDALLARANQKPLFGWGAWGRSRVYNARGQDISTTDGIWVIIMGVDGWLGYLAQFGLLTLPLLVPAASRVTPSPASRGLALLLAANILDMIPNSSLTPLTWLIAGTLTAQLIAAPAARPGAVAAPGPEPGRPDRRPRPAATARDGLRRPGAAPPGRAGARRDPTARSRPG